MYLSTLKILCHNKSEYYQPFVISLFCCCLFWMHSQFFHEPFLTRLTVLHLNSDWLMHFFSFQQRKLIWTWPISGASQQSVQSDIENLFLIRLCFLINLHWNDDKFPKFLTKKISTKYQSHVYVPANVLTFFAFASPANISHKYLELSASILKGKNGVYFYLNPAAWSQDIIQ